MNRELSAMVKEIKSCKRCGLWKTRKNPVIGDGSPNSRIMLIGEAPGYNEDISGKPFVGEAGKILNELLKSVGLERKDVYITNILKCRPPGNRNPRPEEIKACVPYLDRQISLLKPRIIATLGSFAMSYIFEKFGLKKEKISSVHGKVFKVNNLTGTVKIIPLYHPAVAVYNKNMKTTLLKDFRSLCTE